MELSKESIAFNVDSTLVPFESFIKTVFPLMKKFSRRCSRAFVVFKNSAVFSSGIPSIFAAPIKNSIFSRLWLPFNESSLTGIRASAYL